MQDSASPRQNIFRNFSSQSNHASQPSMLNRIPSMCNLTRANAAAVNSAKLTLQNCKEAGHWSDNSLTYLFPLERPAFTYISRCALIPLELATRYPATLLPCYPHHSLVDCTGSPYSMTRSGRIGKMPGASKCQDQNKGQFVPYGAFNHFQTPIIHSGFIFRHEAQWADVPATGNFHWAAMAKSSRAVWEPNSAGESGQ